VVTKLEALSFTQEQQYYE